MARFVFNIEKLEEAIFKDNKHISQILLSHNYIFNILNKYILVKLDKDITYEAGLNFNQLVQIASNLGLESNLASAAYKLNTFRNGIAHEGKYPDDDKFQKLESCIKNAIIEINKLLKENGEKELAKYEKIMEKVHLQGNNSEVNYGIDDNYKKLVSVCIFICFLIDKHTSLTTDHKILNKYKKLWGDE